MSDQSAVLAGWMLLSDCDVDIVTSAQHDDGEIHWSLIRLCKMCMRISEEGGLRRSV